MVGSGLQGRCEFPSARVKRQRMMFEAQPQTHNGVSSFHQTVSQPFNVLSFESIKRNHTHLLVSPSMLRVPVYLRIALLEIK